MKKITVIILSMLLVLVVGQTAFSKSYIQLEGSYYGTITSNNLSTYPPKLFTLGLSGKYDFTDKVSLVGTFSFHSVSEALSSSVGPVYEVDLYTRFNIFNRKNINVGLNVGLMYQGYLSHPQASQERWYNDIFLIVGAYGEVYLSPKIKAYGEISMPIINASLYTISTYSTSRYWVIRFLSSNSSYFTGKLGIQYEITPRIFLGLEYYVFRNFPTNSNRFNINLGYSF